MAHRSATTTSAVAMSSTSRRRSPLREATYPPSSPAGPSTASATAHPSERHSTRLASSNRSARPKSFINLILRSSSADNTTSASTSPRDAQASKPTGAKEAYGPAVVPKSTSRWDKRASRKAPLPPSVRSADEVGARSQRAHDRDHAHEHMPDSTDGPELTRQPGKQMLSHGLEDEVRDLWTMDESSEDMMDGQKGWVGVESLPKVFLFPPEEDEIQPIKLYPPPPPPPVLDRPPLIHLEQTSSRPSSLFSVESSMSGHSARNTWGGMEKQFGKPPPRFRRGGANVLAASGIVMPKKREQVVRERERRMSTYAPENMNWEAGASALDVAPPVERIASFSAQSDTTPVQMPSSPPTATYDHPARPQPPYVAQRSSSAPPMMAMSPPMILITSDSLGSLTTETAHSAESFGLEDSDPPASSADHAHSSAVIVDSPTACTPPSLPHALPIVDSPTSQVFTTAKTSNEDVSSLPSPRADRTGLDFDLGLPAASISPTAAETSSIAPAAIEPPVKASSTPIPARDSKSRNRRSMSLTAVLAPKVTEEVPPIPTAASGIKTIRKHKSLKKFFFSSDNLAKQEREPVPVLDTAHIQNSEAPRRDPKNKSQKPEKAEPERTEAEQVEGKPDKAKDDKKREMNKRSSLSGMLSRPKSKPSLRIDVKAPVSTASSAQGSATAETSATTPAPLSGSSAATSSTSASFPETPSSKSSSRSKAKVATPAPETKGGSRGLTKRFSLSNMSSAFKRSKKDAVAVPQVPDLPAAYKRDKTGRSMSADSASTPSAGVIRDIKHSAVPLSPKLKLQESAIIDSPISRTRPLLSPRSSPGSITKDLPDPEPPSPGASSFRSVRSVRSVSSETSGHTLNALGSPSHDASSILSDTSSSLELETELNHAQLMHVSPRTRRNPAESLQDILGVAPITRQSTVVKMDPVLSRRSVEAIVLGPLLMSPGEMATLSEEDEYGSANSAMNARRGSDESTSNNHRERLAESHSRSRSPPRQYDSESSLETLSRSSSTSDPLEHPAPVTPSSADCGPMLDLPPPLPPLGSGDITGTNTAMSSLPSDDGVMVATPSMQEMYDSPTSTVTATTITMPSRRSPEGLFRFLSSGHSPKTNPKDLDDTSKAGQKAAKSLAQKGSKVTAAFPPPPPIPESKEYSSLNNEVQLRSLHFDSGLGLDFAFGFGADVAEGREVDVRTRKVEVEVEALA